MNFSYEIKNQKLPRTILWQRSEQQFLVNNDNKVSFTIYVHIIMHRN